MSDLFSTGDEIGKSPEVEKVAIFDDFETDSPGAAPRERAFETEEERMRRQAQEMLENAQRTLDGVSKQSEKILAAARKKSEEVEAKAYQAGFEQGEAAGQQLGEQKIEPVYRNLGSILDAILEQRDALVTQSEEQLVELAVMIALQLIHREIQQDPSVVLDVVRAAIAKLRRTSHLTIHASPPDFKFLEAHVDQLRSSSGADTKIIIESDPSIARGGCFITSDTGEIDASIDGAVAALKSRVLGKE